MGASVVMKINIPSVPAFYINMEDAHQRKNNFVSWNKDLGFNNVTRIAGVYDEKYYVGLSKAFVNALESGIKLEEEKFIVFEDDATPTEKFKNEIEIPDDADAVYLGVGPWGFSKDEDPNGGANYNGSVFEEVNNFPGIFKIHSTLTGHAILYINKNYAKAALKSYKMSVILERHSDAQIYFDGLFDKYNVYAIGPLFYQNDLSKPSVLHATKNINMKELKNNE
jgi:hypothetical protein